MTDTGGEVEGAVGAEDNSTNCAGNDEQAEPLAAAGADCGGGPEAGEEEREMVEDAKEFKQLMAKRLREAQQARRIDIYRSHSLFIIHPPFVEFPDRITRLSQNLTVVDMDFEIL